MLTSHFTGEETGPEKASGLPKGTWREPGLEARLSCCPWAVLVEAGNSDLSLCLNQLRPAEDGWSHTPSNAHDPRARLVWREAQRGHWPCLRSRHVEPSPSCQLHLLTACVYRPLTLCTPHARVWDPEVNQRPPSSKTSGYQRPQRPLQWLTATRMTLWPHLN